METNRTILILRETNEAFSDVEIYLRSRGTQLTVVHNARQAVQFITESKPDFAILSAKLLPKKSAWLVGILNQLTNVVVHIGRLSARTIEMTRDLNGIALLESPLTPIGLEQVFRKAEREREKQLLVTSQLDRTQTWIMSTLADLSLKQICKAGSSNQSQENVQTVRRIICYRLQTQTLSGYFVLAYGKDRVPDAKWLEQLRTQMSDYVTHFSETTDLTEPQEVWIEEVRFKEWSKEQAEFILQAIHQESEIALAFFKDPEPIEVQNSGKPDCVKIPVDRLPEEMATQFDIFIFLPQNARFVLYSRKGERFDDKQKRRLQDEGISSVHVSKRSFDELQKYQTKRFIEESSLAFQNPSPSPA
jgi:DNA-binding response OmpR family regulator